MSTRLTTVVSTPPVTKNYGWIPKVVIGAILLSALSFFLYRRFINESQYRIMDPYLGKYVGRGETPMVTRANFTRLREGMTQRQVENILGKPFEELRDSHTVIWRERHHNGLSRPTGVRIRVLFRHGLAVELDCSENE